LIGVNSRMDTIQAAILNVKIKYINEWLKKRNAFLDSTVELRKTTSRQNQRKRCFS